MGDKLGNSQMRPFIVWFGEAVPMIEQSIDIVEKADIFVVIGTSLNVYPAAGLLHYVKNDVPIYLIDPNPVNVSRDVHVIALGASAGVEKLAKELKEKYV